PRAKRVRFPPELRRRAVSSARRSRPMTTETAPPRAHTPHARAHDRASPDGGPLADLRAPRRGLRVPAQVPAVRMPTRGAADAPVPDPPRRPERIVGPVGPPSFERRPALGLAFRHHPLRDLLRLGQVLLVDEQADALLPQL